MSEIKPIAYIHSDFDEKFGIPRQSGLVEECISEIVFEKEYRDANYIRGIENFSHLWLIWQFSENANKKPSPTVRPPRLGGNTRIGVFATRSPFRPNSLGLSSVKLCGIKKDKENGNILLVSGADLMNMTPIFDIKPYLAYTDSHPDAVCGFTEKCTDKRLEIKDINGELEKMPPDFQNKLISVLSRDVRPSYQNDDDRIYKMTFAKKEITFRIINETAEIISIY